MTKNLFISATRQNDGKTMVSLGLFKAFQQRFDPISYIKPVGQEYHWVDNEKIDKDAILFQDVYQTKDALSDMSPVAVHKGFTEEYIQNRDPHPISERIKNSYNALAKNKDFVLIEGTGHAGVGSVFDHANAQVAKLLGSKAIIVALGGIGRSIDELMLNKACFDQMGVEIIGVIVNKIQKDKYERVKSAVKQGLDNKGIKLLGAIPYIRMLSSPSIKVLLDGLKAELLSGGDFLNNKADTVLIGAMASHDALNYFTPNTFLIVPGNRDDLIMTALFVNNAETVNYSISGMVFTGGIEPNEKVLEMIKLTEIPAMVVPEDSYTVATRINNMIIKVRSEETQKIDTVQSLIEEYVDVDQICSLL